MRAEIKLLHQRLKTTAVYVTHDQVEAMTLGHKIAVMKDGEIQQFGTPDEIYQRPANLFVAAFMGAPAINILRARIVLEEGRPGLRLAQEGSRLHLPLSNGRLAAWAGREVLLACGPSTSSMPAARHRPRGTALSGAGGTGRAHRGRHLCGGFAGRPAPELPRATQLPRQGG